jgi:putative glutathione S-transferase
MAGFATTQAVYEDALTALFDGLDVLETTLTQTRFLLGRENL